MYQVSAEIHISFILLQHFISHTEICCALSKKRLIIDFRLELKFFNRLFWSSGLKFLSNYFFSPVEYSRVKKAYPINVYLYVKEITFFKDKEFTGASGWSQLVDELIVTRRNRVSSTMYRLVLSFVWCTNNPKPLPGFSFSEGLEKTEPWLHVISLVTFCCWRGSSCWSINANFTFLLKGQGNMASYSPFITLIYTERYLFLADSTPLG